MSISAQPNTTVAGVGGVALDSSSKRGTLLSQVRSLRSLRRAFEKVARNKKAVAGIDDVSVAAFARHPDMELRAIARLLREEKYQFSPLRPVAIPKKDKKTYRPLLIPTVADRVVQRAILHQLSRYIGPHIAHRNSHAFRSDFGVKSAVMQLAGELKRGRRVVLVVDIENFFGAIEGQRLFDEVMSVLPDRSLEPLLRQLQRWELNDLSSLPIYKRGCFPQGGKGVPQGSALSPILSNFFLRHLDAEIGAKGLAAVRYADDIAVACDSVSEANDVFAWLDSHLRSRGLTIHPIGHKKSRLIEIGENGVTGVEYLGFFLSPANGDTTVSISSRSFGSAKATVDDFFSITTGMSLADRFVKLTYFLNSWLGTFGNVCTTDSERAQLLDCVQRHLSDLLVDHGLLRAGQGLTQKQRIFLGVDSIFERAGRPRRIPDAKRQRN
jgi:CRISPR-associated protein Cas1